MASTHGIDRSNAAGGSGAPAAGASSVTFTPTGTIAATDVQAAIAEAASEALQKSSNLSDVTSAATARANLDVPSNTEAILDTIVDAAGDLIIGTAADTVGRLAAAEWRAIHTCDFRLTLTTAVPVTTADVTGATTVYCSPYKGNQIALFDGTNWVVRASAEFSLALGTLTSGLPYDVFCYDNATVPTLEFLAWTNGTTRATALVLQNGVLSKTGALTRRYMGTFYTTSTTATADAEATRYLWNYYNRVARNTRASFSANRSTTSATYTEVNTEIRNGFLLGVSEDAVHFDMASPCQSDNSTNLRNMSVGIDSTTVAEDTVAQWQSALNAQTQNGMSLSFAKIGLAVGLHYATLLGKTAAGTITFDGSGTAGTRTTLHGVVMG